MMPPRLWACALLGSAIARICVGAELLFDFNSSPTPLGSLTSKQQHAHIGALTLFVMDDGSRGAELWLTDGTAAGTALVKDINPGPTGSSPTALTELNGKVVFFADDGTNGNELWVSDGTSAGTHLVANIDGNSNTSVISFGGPLQQLNGAVLFSARPPSSDHYTLWRSDGTSMGTWQVKDVDTGSGIGAFFTGSTVVGSHLFFAGRDPVYGREPWVTDGTPDGTHVIGDIAPGTADSNPTEFTATLDAVYFSAQNATVGGELWRTDLNGTVASLVSDLIPGPNGSAPQHLTSLGKQLFYAGTEAPGLPVNTAAGGGFEPYISDGSVAGTHRVMDIFRGSRGSDPSPLVVLGNRVIFELGDAPGTASTVWTSDGTQAQTVPLLNYQFKAALLATVVQLNGKVLFVGQLGAPYGTDAVWQTDGTPEGTSIFANIPSGYGSGGDELVAYGGKVYFPDGFPATGPAGRELWSADGTSKDPKSLDLNPGPVDSGPNNLYVSNGKLYFGAGDHTFGYEPWVSDGTAAGSKPLCDCNPAVTTPDSNAVVIANLGSRALVSANDGTHGIELWATDGTSAGTKLVRDINSGPNSSSPGAGMVLNGVAYFAADDGVNGNELWRSDGTAAGTYMVTDIAPGQVAPPVCQPGLYCPPPSGPPPPASSDPYMTPFGSLATVVNGVIYFSANDVTHGRELWRTDGTAAGTRMVADLVPGQQGSYIQFAGAVGSRVFFCANTGTTVPQLYVTDGTAQGTTLVSNRIGCKIFSYTAGAVLNGVLYFPGTTDNSNYELWRTDGTDAGTYRVTSTAPRTFATNPDYMQVVGDRLAFSACEPTSCGFFLSDGTATGTVRVPGIPQPGILTLMGNEVLFSASPDGSAPMVGYVSDGTVAGTRQFLPSNLFPKGINLMYSTKYLGKYVFDALNDYGGQDAWISDGTAAGTHPLLQAPGGANGDVGSYGFTVVGNSLLFSARDATHGTEMWVVRNGAPSASGETVNVAFNTPTTVDVLANDAPVATALDQSSVSVVSHPAHGSVTVNSGTGAIVYTPQAGFSGMDQLTYQVTDTGGRVSNFAPVILLVTAPVGASPASPPAGSTSPTLAPPPVVTPPPPDTSNPPTSGTPSDPPGNTNTLGGGTGATGGSSSSSGTSSANGSGGGGNESWLTVALLGLLVFFNLRRSWHPGDPWNPWNPPRLWKLARWNEPGRLVEPEQRP
jgi:ELWxxDGT repeat protein